MKTVGSSKFFFSHSSHSSKHDRLVWVSTRRPAATTLPHPVKQFSVIPNIPTLQDRRLMFERTLSSHHTTVRATHENSASSQSPSRSLTHAFVAPISRLHSRFSPHTNVTLAEGWGCGAIFRYFSCFSSAPIWFFFLCSFAFFCRLYFLFFILQTFQRFKL